MKEAEMSIPAIFSAYIFFLLLISYICIYRNLFSKFNCRPVMMNHVILSTTHLSSGWNFLFQPSNFWRSAEQTDVVNGEEELSISRYESEGSEGTTEECAVCLYKIEEGDEIRELRCGHLFHRVCLDRWVGFRHQTCPLCRDFLTSRGLISELGEEVLVFKFSSFSSSDRSSWWLR
uniref:Putative E3 ubiquitin-protein ligase RNF38-like n=1 Tax=Davidia involucrata TaxID=16924 RepID=A0A5B7A6X6_DAVIN